MRALSALLISLTSCVATECVTQLHTDSLYVCSEFEHSSDFSDMLDEVVLVVETEAHRRYPQVNDLAAALYESSVAVTLTRDRLAKNCVAIDDHGTWACDEYVNGLNRGGTEILARWVNNCRADSGVLAHELLHFIEHYYFANAHDDHNLTPFMFIDRDHELSIESRVYAQLGTYCK